MLNLFCCVQPIKISGVTYTFTLVCLAGNHSCWAAKEVLRQRNLKDKISGRDIQFRHAWLYCDHELSADLKYIMSGTIFHHVHHVVNVFHVFTMFTMLFTTFTLLFTMLYYAFLNSECFLFCSL